MPSAATSQILESTHLGRIEWESGSELYLPLGLPGFESERYILPVEVPAKRPLIFLQSIALPDVCFVALPVNILKVPFSLQLSEEDRAALMLEAHATTEMGVDVLCLALVLPAADSIRVNLDAPIVINLHNSRCVQSVSPSREGGYYNLSSFGWERSC